MTYENKFTSSVEGCKQVISQSNLDLLRHMSLVPATAIILILSFVNRRPQRMKTCNGRILPGVVIPFNFLGGNDSNRLSVAVAFGFLASSVFDVLQDKLTLQGFTVVKGFKDG